MDKTQVKMLLEVSDKDIKELKRVRKVLSEYTKYEQKLVDDLMARMRANHLNELGDVKLVTNKNIITAELGELTKPVLPYEVIDRLIVNIDIEKSTKNLRDNNFNDVHIYPLFDILRIQFGKKSEVLVINENVSDRK